MAHFAKIGLNGKVISVSVLNNSDMLNADGVEDETVGQQYLQLHNNWPAPMWIQTSYNTLQNKHNSGDNSKAFRGNYAGIGHTWDEDNNIFWPKKPYASWVKDTSDASWHSPIGDAPDLGAESETHHYEWNESNQSWDKTEQ
jgi:hypothetical protein|tara:strand:+ start:702 stop:1127 length:426 start_codon:yes stop_codon:yes gene_type:complete